MALADHAVAHALTAAVAQREIDAALAADDADLAQSFLDLAREQNLPVDAALAEKVRLASVEAASAARSIGSFARGLVTGEPQDLSGLVGTAVGDLFVFGDIRDAVREGGRLAAGQEVDELILGLACVGLAVTAGTYVTVGLAAPARVGLTVVKAAGKAGRLGGRMTGWISRSLREIVDWSALSRAARGASIAGPAAAVRAARGAVKVEKARDLVRLAGDVGRVQRAGGHAGGARRVEGRPWAARHVADGPAGGCQRRQDPRHSQARRPRRHPADGRHVRSANVDVLGGAHDVRFGVVAQAHDREGDRALLRAPQAAPDTPTAGARAGGTTRAGTKSARAEDGRTDRHCFPGAGLVPERCRARRNTRLRS